MKRGVHLSRTLLLVAAVAWLAGCASTPPSRFYTLNSLGPPETKQPSRDASHSVSVRVAPVEIPDYLDRPQIVTRDGRNEVKLAELDRWAGSLSDNISAVLAENLSMLLGSDRVFIDTVMPVEKTNYLVTMRILRLDCVPGDHVLLKAQWAVIGAHDTKEVATRVSTLTEKLNDSRYETLTAAVSQTLGQVSREIAREILDRPKEGPVNPPGQVGP